MALIGENERLVEQISNKEKGFDYETSALEKERDGLLVRCRALQSNYDISTEDTMARDGL